MSILGCLILNTGYGQWSVNTSTSLSYSGLAQLAKIEYVKDHFVFGMGPKFNMSRSNYLWSDIPGITVETDYRLKADGFTGYTFFRYDYSGRAHTHIHELFAGYGAVVPISKQMEALGNLGVGMYQEGARNKTEFRLNGITFCSTVGLSYRF